MHKFFNNNKLSYLVGNTVESVFELTFVSLINDKKKNVFKQINTHFFKNQFKDDYILKKK